MAKEAVFTMKLEPELRDAFMAAAEAADRPASQIVREFMRDFVEQDREYVEFLRRKVEKARKSIEAGRGRPDEEVRADFARRRAEWERRARERDA
ncbi:antitoxin of toxin-antitoxin stability system [Mesorhizobium sp. LHD-90]|uniref:antitoxin of toxin-antitoxin stability system n=1 Tax=Mesorhizobium sp. LHD-90 TaxID=3071414 RepID=UPI0027DEBF34|nr:antitoxin of toxin-antitoxin stability system [Mesorhizobium sp. LHD-90]MDQ6435850.1 antitoxin of toxin-antitoxin stability system [Mesorhizobium sp. LHD-90]